MLIAIATDDGNFLMGRHFGDSVAYDLYLLTENEVVFQETIKNPFRDNDEDKDVHGDKSKAKNMKVLFLEKGVSVLVSKKFGPNIKHMVKNFIPVIIRHDSVEIAKKLLVEHIAQITNMLNADEERKPVILDSSL